VYHSQKNKEYPLKGGNTISVIGGAGHVGLPLCLTLAKHGFHVYGIDTNQESNDAIMRGTLPFKEEMGKEYLDEALSQGTLYMTNDTSVMQESKIVVITLGTPLDKNLNPWISDLIQTIIENSRYFSSGQLIILRSTVYPGTTEAVKRILEKGDRFTVGKDILLVYAPERVVQGKSIMEIQELPQLIGTFDDNSYQVAEEFFKSFIKAECLRLSPVEAELGKLFCNMYRYVNFALANEFYLISDLYKANIHNIIDSCNYKYPRMNIPRPGPNVAGPCLFKDGWFLLERLPFNEIISASFKINEGMPMQIVTRIEQMTSITKATILGVTFKAGSDDTRNSLSLKLKNQLLRNGYEVILVDPNVIGYQSIKEIEGSDVVILMTPHEEFKDFNSIKRIVANDNCLFVDIWGFWDSMKYKSQNGFFFGKDV